MNVPAAVASKVNRIDISSKGEIVNHADVAIWKGPTLSALIEKDHVKQVMLLRVVNENVSPTSAFRGFQGQRGIELKDQ
jgi:hypothetical protein